MINGSKGIIIEASKTMASETMIVDLGSRGVGNIRRRIMIDWGR